MNARAVPRAFLGLVAWALTVCPPAWCQVPATPAAVSADVEAPAIPAAVSAEIDVFYDGVDDATKEFLREALGRGIGPGSFTAESALEQTPKEQLADQRAQWLALIEGDLYQAIENLGASHCVEAVPALLRVATDREPGDLRARWLAVRALGRIGDERAILELIYLVNYHEENTRMWARASLHRLTGQWFGHDREAWGNWWNETGGDPRYVAEERYPAPPMRVIAAEQIPAKRIMVIAENGKRGWGPEQATGEPDTTEAGDIVTAWASLTPDGAREWLELEYEGAVAVAGVNVRETYNPGAVCMVTAISEDGTETLLWEGKGPTREAPGMFAVPVQGEITARRIKVYLDSPRVPGWNEIDAVELVGKDGSRQWAQSATASSTYAEQARHEFPGGPREVGAPSPPTLPLPTCIPPHLGSCRERAVYWNDFEDPATAGKGWSRQDTFRLPVRAAGVDAPMEPVTPTTVLGRFVRAADDLSVETRPRAPTAEPATPTTVLGRFGSEPVSLTLEGLPPHRFVQIAFEFHALSSWDGHRPRFGGPDLWEARIEDGPRLVYASFANYEAPQSYPLPFGLMETVGRVGGRRFHAEIPYDGGQTWGEHAVYPMCFTVPHTGKELRVQFTGIGLEPVLNESWALDNVGVALLNENPPRELTPAQMEQAWTDLAAVDIAVAYPAVQALVAAGDQSVAFLAGKPGWQPDPEARDRFAELTGVLAHDDRTQWDEAAGEAQSAGPRSFPLVFAAVDKRRFGPNPPPFLSELLDGWSPPKDAGSEALREGRAACVLELIWSPAARQALLFE